MFPAMGEFFVNKAEVKRSKTIKNLKGEGKEYFIARIKFDDGAGNTAEKTITLRRREIDELRDQGVRP